MARDLKLTFLLEVEILTKIRQAKNKLIFIEKAVKSENWEINFRKTSFHAKKIKKNKCFGQHQDILKEWAAEKWTTIYLFEIFSFSHRRTSALSKSRFHIFIHWPGNHFFALASNKRNKFSFYSHTSKQMYTSFVDVVAVWVRASSIYEFDHVHFLSSCVRLSNIGWFD